MNFFEIKGVNINWITGKLRAYIMGEPSTECIEKMPVHINRYKKKVFIV